MQGGLCGSVIQLILLNSTGTTDLNLYYIFTPFYFDISNILLSSGMNQGTY